MQVVTEVWEQPRLPREGMRSEKRRGTGTAMFKVEAEEHRGGRTAPQIRSYGRQGKGGFAKGRVVKQEGNNFKESFCRQLSAVKGPPSEAKLREGQHPIR